MSIGRTFCPKCGKESSLPLPEERRVSFRECKYCGFRWGFWWFAGAAP